MSDIGFVFPSDVDRSENEHLDVTCEKLEELMDDYDDMVRELDYYKKQNSELFDLIDKWANISNVPSNLVKQYVDLIFRRK